MHVVFSGVAETRASPEHAKCKAQGDKFSESIFTLHHVINPWKKYDAECDCPTCGQPENAAGMSLLASFKVRDVECKLSVKD